MIRSIGWPLIIIVSAVVLGTMVTQNIESPFRLLLTLWFVLVCPGMAFVRLLRFEDRLVELVLAIALSIAIGTILSEAMVLAKAWSFIVCFTILIILSVIGSFLQIWMAYRQIPKATEVYKVEKS